MDSQEQVQSSGSETLTPSPSTDTSPSPITEAASSISEATTKLTGLDKLKAEKSASEQKVSPKPATPLQPGRLLSFRLRIRLTTNTRRVEKSMKFRRNSGL